MEIHPQQMLSHWNLDPGRLRPDIPLCGSPERCTKRWAIEDADGNTWFARDIADMAEVLGTEPLLVVARDLSQPDGPVTPLPVDTSAIPNDHLQYAVTWFGLAAIWTAMMGYFLFRLRKPSEGAA